MGTGFVMSLFRLLLVSYLLSGCAVKYIETPQELGDSEDEWEFLDGIASAQPFPRKPNLGPGLKFRAVTEKELAKLSENDPELTRSAALEILARLNIKGHYYIPEDIKQKRPMKVPNDFSAYKKWTPMPRRISSVAKNPKFILVVKDIPFLGWYEKGRLVGDSYICIGKKWEWTKKGNYKVENKDAYHISSSYPNAYGIPAPMPFALRIYEHVWIHMGDIAGGYLSHGCINLPMSPSERLFEWAQLGTPVVIVDSLKDLDKDLKTYASRASGR